MYFHIEKIKFIKIPVETKTFTKIINQHLNEINLEKNKQWKKTLKEENQFIRFTNSDHYADRKIIKIISKEHFTILLGEMIDCSKKNTRDNKGQLKIRK